MAIPAFSHEDTMLATELHDFHGKIQSYIGRRVGDLDITNDLTSHTFCKATEAIFNGKGPRKSPSGWLYRIAHNAVIDHYRMRDRQRTGSLENFPNLVCDSADPANHVDAMELRSELMVAMRVLTPGQQQVIQLRYIKGYSFAEIAEEMDTTKGAVKAMKHRALNTLRMLMSRGNHE